jgi:hypothetical protein
MRFVSFSSQLLQVDAETTGCLRMQYLPTRGVCTTAGARNARPLVQEKGDGTLLLRHFENLVRQNRGVVSISEDLYMRLSCFY